MRGSLPGRIPRWSAEALILHRAPFQQKIGSGDCSEQTWVQILTPSLPDCPNSVEVQTLCEPHSLPLEGEESCVFCLAGLPTKARSKGAEDRYLTQGRSSRRGSRSPVFFGSDNNYCYFAGRLFLAGNVGRPDYQESKHVGVGGTWVLLGQGLIQGSLSAYW